MHGLDGGPPHERRAHFDANMEALKGHPVAQAFVAAIDRKRVSVYKVFLVEEKLLHADLACDA